MPIHHHLRRFEQMYDLLMQSRQHHMVHQTKPSIDKSQFRFLPKHLDRLNYLHRNGLLFHHHHQELSCKYPIRYLKPF